MTKMPDQWKCDSCGQVTTAQYKVEGTWMLGGEYYRHWAFVQNAGDEKRVAWYGEAATLAVREIKEALEQMQCALDLPNPLTPYQKTRVDLCPDCYGTILRWLHGEKLPQRDGRPEMPQRHELSLLGWLWKHLKGGTPRDREWV